MKLESCFPQGPSSFVRATLSDSRCGTAGSVAPEILNGGEADLYNMNVDVYSVRGVASPSSALT